MSLWAWMSVVLVLGSVLYQLNVLIVIVQVAFVLTCMLAGAAVGFRLFIRQQRIHEAQVEDVYRSPSRELFIKILNEEEERKQQEENRDAHAHPVIISLAVDQALGEAIQLTMRDYVISWYQEISNDTNEFSKVLEADVWEMLQQLTKKSRDIDKVQVISQDVVQKLCDHFRSIRHCSSRNEMFSLHPCLMSEETETEYLRQACDVILVLALPAKHQQASVIRYLLREVMLSVLKPCIDMVCDPDYINQKLVIWLESRETEYETHRRTYAYAATYETFIKMINACTDIEQLKQIRYHIITEIMQATVINNWKKAQGIETDRDAQPTSSAKGALLKARNLHRYIKQCRYAKAQCEYRIRMLGGAEYLSYRSRERQAGVHVPGKKALSFTAIMETVEGRKAFLEYLQRTGLESLLEFWEGVEKLRSSPKVKQHGVATELYQRHLLSSSSSAVKLDRAIVKHMEAFLVADKGPEGFYEAQQELFDTLEDRFYPSFLVSDVYNSYVGNMYDPAGASRATPDAAADESNARSTLERQASEGPSLGQQCVYAQRKLTALEERFRNKSRALQALRNSHRPDPKTIGKLEQAVQEMTQEQLQLQSHIDRTETWSENCSCWRVEIDGYQVVQDEGRSVPYFTIMVFLVGKASSTTTTASTTSAGWVVSRNLGDLKTLHQHLVAVAPWLTSYALPISKTSFRSVDERFLDRAKTILEQYLNTCLSNEVVACSEMLYYFLSPSLEHIRPPQPALKPASSSFRFANLFARSSAVAANDLDADLELFLDDESGREDQERDSIARPMYALISEVFELSGVFSFLRRTLIVFVQVTFGSSINKQIHDTVGWLFSESMLIWYIHLFRDAMWPGGKLAECGPARSDEEKLTTRALAKAIVLRNIPEALSNLVGQQNARQGTIKVFEALQERRANKHLFMTLFDLAMMELCPELSNTPPGGSDLVT